ncbi:hypothetical protein RJ641_012985 [Dillenia turbinata]|uniref:Uncharacterized protein n=1 Tax=Dillenia turbinata TaxID=194707 RepID=A0AAN8USM8_9MAGN
MSTVHGASALRLTGTSDGDMEPLGTKSRLQLRYWSNNSEALSTSRSRARKNLLIMKSSTSCNRQSLGKVKRSILSRAAQGLRPVS